jgi:hypothetical protein
MDKSVITVVIADLILVGGIVLVIQDIQMRTNCTLDGCQPFARSSAGFTYSVLTKTFSFDVNGNTLTSPLTLDWVQVLVLALVIVNFWYGYRALTRRGRPVKPPATVETGHSSEINTMKKQMK